MYINLNISDVKRNAETKVKASLLCQKGKNGVTTLFGQRGPCPASRTQPDMHTPPSSRSWPPQYTHT